MRVLANMKRGMLVAASVLGTATVTGAQQTAEPYDALVANPVISMGLPSRNHPHVGGFASWRQTGAGDRRGGGVLIGAYRDMGNPIVGLLALGAEAYTGSAPSLDGGVRLLAVSPALFSQVGVDVSARTGDVDLLISVTPPLRRGGLFGRARQLRIDWLPTRDHAVDIGITIPVGQPWLGRARPRSTHAALPQLTPRPTPPTIRDSALMAVLEEAATAAHWITSYTSYPSLDDRGPDRRGLRRFAAGVGAWRDSVRRRDAVYPRGRRYSAVVAQYHASFERAVALAVHGDTVVAREIATAVRKTLLDDVLLPYNRLIGQDKGDDGLRGLGAVARTRLGHWLTDSIQLPAVSRDRVLGVLDAIVDIAEASRRSAQKVWRGDSRPVWIPLQLALRPQDHDTQQELNALIERAADEQFTEGNELAGASASWFMRGVVTSIRMAEDYHILWVHDYRGTNDDGTPDAVALATTVRGYLDALTDRVRKYDRNGTLPVYMILIDQYFYEETNGRLWLELLQNPLEHRVKLKNFPAMRLVLERAQRELREAVAQSPRLQAEAATRGGSSWLRNVVKVHVSVTNQPDWSVRSGYGFGGFPLVPDHRMRDHRKIAVYDVTESDPSRGGAIFAGTGVGELYTSNLWEDRAIFVRGPAALSVKAAARRALLQQGFGSDEIPEPLRETETPADYATLVEERTRSGAPISMLSVHNEVGFGAKKATLVRAMLYTLMPAGSVIYAPDPFWSSSTWGGQLIGAALRGCHVFIISPAYRSAPVRGILLARQRDLMARLLEVQRILADEFADAGGGFRVGFYTRNAGMQDLPARLREAALGYRRNAFLRDALPFAGSLAGGLTALADSLQQLGYEPAVEMQALAEGDPLLHRKTQFLGTRDALEELVSSPAARRITPLLMQTHTDAAFDQDSTLAAVAEDMRVIRDLIALHHRMPNATRERAVYFATIGSMNMDPVSARSNGEVTTVVAGPASVMAFLDFFQLVGSSTWPATQAELDALIPRSSRLTRWIAHRFRQML